MSFGQGGPDGAHEESGQQPWGPPPGQQTPDWAALADGAAARGRRRKWLLIGGGVLAAGAVAAIVATAVVQSGKGGKAADRPHNGKLPSASASPEPTFTPVTPPSPPDPRDFIASAAKDKAPLSATTLFPNAGFTVGPRGYERTATSEDTDCASVTQGGLGSVLSGNDCRRVLRATYVRGGVAVTVGVAVFDAKATADQVKDRSTGNIAALTGGGSPAFCHGPSCRTSANAAGRYAYFTIAGYTNGKPVTADDTQALTAGRDVAAYAFDRILARGRAQAAAAVSATPKGV